MMVALLKRLRAENGSAAAGTSPRPANAASSSSTGPTPAKPPAAAGSPAPARTGTVSHAQVLGTTRAPKGTFSVRETVGRVLHIAPADIHRIALTSYSYNCCLSFFSETFVYCTLHYESCRVNNVC